MRTEIEPLQPAVNRSSIMTASEQVRSSFAWWDDSDVLQLTLCALAAVVAFAVLRRSSAKGKGRRGGKLPPGPWPWPIVGNLGELGAFIHRDLARLAGKYGPILSLRLGSVPTVVVSSPKVAEQILKTHDRVFASRPRTTASKILSYDNGSISFAPYGPYWRHVRKVFTVELFTARRIQNFQSIRTEEMLLTLRSILAECKEGTAEVCVTDKFLQLTWNITSRILINKSLFARSGADTSGRSNWRDRGMEYVQVFKDLVRLSGSVIVGDYIPFLRRFDIQGIVRQMWETRGKLDEMIDEIIEEHRTNLKLSLGQAGSDEGRHDHYKMDIVDVLLTRPGGWEDDEKPLTMGQIKGILKDGFVAGTDVTAVTSTWAMAELLCSPHALKRAQQELDDVVGRTRLVEESDLPRLPYLRAIVKETFRLHPAGPLLVPHESVEDCEVEGYFIPAGTRVFVNVWAIGRDAAVWERALDFWPERFLGCETDVLGQHFELLPFGSGRRSCPGRSLAVLTVQYTLAVHLHACDWSLPPGMKIEDVDMSEAPGISVARTSPLHLLAAPRLPRLPLHTRPSQ